MFLCAFQFLSPQKMSQSARSPFLSILNNKVSRQLFREFRWEQAYLMLFSHFGNFGNISVGLGSLFPGLLVISRSSGIRQNALSDGSMLDVAIAESVQF